MNSIRMPPRGLYAITCTVDNQWLTHARAMLDGGARILQFSDNQATAINCADELGKLRQLCNTHQVPLLIEQDVRFAHILHASGVHLIDHREVVAARTMLGPSAIIGVSCRDSLADAEAAVQAGADYVSFGVFFRSPTKPLATIAPMGLLKQSAALGVPRVAIGGITPENGHLLVDAGADLLAAISAVTGAADVRGAAQRISNLYLPRSSTSR